MLENIGEKILDLILDLLAKIIGYTSAVIVILMAFTPIVGIVVLLIGYPALMIAYFLGAF